MRLTPALALSAILAGSLAWGGEARTVRVAAVQCYSRMRETEYNRRLLTRLIEQAAKAEAKIVVLPECAVHGYMDPGRDLVWTAKRKGRRGEIPVHGVGEPVPGPSTRYFAQLAARLAIYLVVPLLEEDDGKFYNAQVLLDPQGKQLLHHRKTHLWAPGDGLWVTPGKLPLQVADTPYGRLGLMICYEVHRLPTLLKKANVDIVLYSVGWYGPNTEGWYRDTFPRRYVVPNGFAVIASNWSADEGAPGWPGHGYSCIIDRTGKVLAMARTTRGEEIVLADIPLR